MAENRTADLFADTALGEDLAAADGLILGAGVLFVVEIVKKADDGPLLLVFAEFAGVGADTGFDRKRMFPKTFRLGELS